MNNQAPNDADNIRGEPLTLDVLLDMAEIDPTDLEAAAEWWDLYASPYWVSALDADLVDTNG